LSSNHSIGDRYLIQLCFGMRFVLISWRCAGRLAKTMTGWSEPQIAEAVYITAMFAFFNRVADAFGIASQGYLEMNAATK
jgi:alkylhydroperoxidase family enzyme